MVASSFSITIACIYTSIYRVGLSNLGCFLVCTFFIDADYDLRTKESIVQMCTICKDDRKDDNCQELSNKSIRDERTKEGEKVSNYDPVCNVDH